MIPRPILASLVTFEREIRDYRKNIFYFALRNLIQPVFFVLVIGVGLGSFVNLPGRESYLSFMLPGILMMSVVQVCYQHFSSEIWMSKNHEGYLELLTMTAPIKPREAVAGYLLTGIVVAFFAVLCFLLPVWLLLPGFAISLSALMLFTIGLALFFTSAGIVVGVSVLDPHTLTTVGIFITMPLTYLCGVFVPVEMYPPSFRLMIEVIPLTPAIEGLREGGLPIAEIIYVWCAAALAVVAAIKVFERNMHP
ncbi:MAG: ABC transporter permease [Methanothrix sp.]|jgi:ABC-type multidrug transport system permease subunit|nr:ABC transporter permease [Methanothrix sp.]NLX39496.1 ABC transporter permease [Methanothrix sp.]HOI68548.1 ABC transporter permease [Methanothrix sp.]HPY72224.1 ABC transporter permease [Methanothrix sp.]